MLKKRRRRHKEQRAGHGAAEVEQPVIVARRPADEHVHEHLLDSVRGPGIADEIGAELTLSDVAERHVVAHDLQLLSVLLDRRQSVVRRGWLHGIVQFAVGPLGSAYDSLLCLYG